MRVADLVQRQLITINTILHDVADDLTVEEWTTRILPGVNLIAFDVWHVARAQDWAIQTLIRGVPEVIAEPRWADKGPLATRGIGVGMTREQADDLARQLAKPDVLAYADAMHAVALAWVDTLTDADFDSQPDVMAHYAAFPEYQTAEMRAEAPWAFERPQLWRCLVGPAAGHVRDHLIEIDVLKRQFRLHHEAR